MGASAETKNLVMIMSLRDQISKDLKKVTANLDKMKKQMGGNEQAAKGMNSGLKSVSSTMTAVATSFIAATVGVFSLVEAAKMLVSTSDAIAQSQTQAAFSASMLGQSAVDAYNQIKTSFGTIGEPFYATATQVNAVYGVMQKASGRAVLSVKDLQSALALAKVTGVDFATAAEDIGQALRGNQEPLRALVGAYGYKGLNDVQDKAIATALSGYTAWNKVSYIFRGAKEMVAGGGSATAFNQIPETYGTTTNTVTPYASGGMVNEPTAMIGLRTGKRGIMGEAGPEAIVPTHGGSGGGGQAVFNLYATIADRNSLRSFVQQITPLLQQNNRRGGAAAATYGG
jgi:hypothetical protein